MLYVQELYFNLRINCNIFLIYVIRSCCSQNKMKTNVECSITKIVFEESLLEGFYLLSISMFSIYNVIAYRFERQHSFEQILK